MLLTLTARPALSPAPGQTIRDDTGYTFSIPDQTPARIISLAPNITEILFALGLGANVAGATRFCDFPPEALAVPRVGGFVDPNIELVEALRPDLIIAFRGNPLRFISGARRLGYRLFVLDAGPDLESLFLLVNKVGLITRREKQAAALVAGLRARAEAVEKRVAAARDKPRALFLLSRPGLWTAGRGSWLTDLAKRAGGRNAAGELRGKWLVYKKEQVVKDDPDVVFIMAPSEEAFSRARAELVRELERFGPRAVREGRIHRLDESTASRFGPRLVEALEKIAAALHPESREAGR